MTDEITLTLTPELDTSAITPIMTDKPSSKQYDAMKDLSDKEKEMVASFSKQIDLSNTTQILQYGAGTQQKMASFSEKALTAVQTKDVGEVGNMLTKMVTELKGFDADEEDKGFFGKLFKKSVDRVTALKTKYAAVETNVTEIAGALEKHQIQLMKDISSLDQLYDANKSYYKEITMYILAGKQSLEAFKANECALASAKAQESGLPEDAQYANDLVNQANRFEKKLHDLELTRMVAIQTAPQIRMIQNNDAMMAEKIHSTLVHTIPLWKSQMVLALGLAHSQEAAKVQKAVSDMTNELLKKNAETLKMATIETAKESERGIVDIETLKATNTMLIETLDEVKAIQEQGAEKRKEAEQELANIEGEMKAKLLELATAKHS